MEIEEKVQKRLRLSLILDMSRASMKRRSEILVFAVNLWYSSMTDDMLQLCNFLKQATTMDPVL